MEERVGQLEARGSGPGRGAPSAADDVRPRDDARARLLHGRRELQPPPRPARGRVPAVDAARLLPAGLAAHRRRVAHDRSRRSSGMYKNDRTRKEILVDFGFRLPSALDNRPLTFEEFEAHLNQAVYMSATPGPYELERSERIVEQLIRPTGIVDPPIIVRPTEGQIDDLMEEIREPGRAWRAGARHDAHQEDGGGPADYLKELGVKVQYLHSEVDTLERVAILRDLRLGVYDVLVGINLLREGIDLPEVTLVAILDADKEGFLRSAWSLIQMIGRAARNIGGEVIMYADTVTESMQRRDRRDEPPAARSRRRTTPSTASSRRRSSRRSATSTSACGRSRSGPSSTRRSGGGEFDRRPTGRRSSARRADGGRDARGGQAARVRAGGRAARRDPAGPVAGARGGRVGHRGAGGRAGRAGPARPGAVAAALRIGRLRPPRRRRGAERPARSSRSPASPSCQPMRSPPTRSTATRRGGRRSGGAPPRTGFPGIRDEHEDDGGWQARWLERPTWDMRVTPNIRRRTGQRPGRRGPRGATDGSPARRTAQGRHHSPDRRLARTVRATAKNVPASATIGASHPPSPFATASQAATAATLLNVIAAMFWRRIARQPPTRRLATPATA